MFYPEPVIRLPGWWIEPVPIFDPVPVPVPVPIIDPVPVPVPVPIIDPIPVPVPVVTPFLFARNPGGDLFDDPNTPTEASHLKPEKINYHIKKNSEEHHTDEYDENVYGLVVRRGQEFQVEVTFDRAYDPKQDQLILLLTYGTRPKESKNTTIRLKNKNTELSNSMWGMHVESNGNNVILTIMSPANALVGEYKVYVETKTKKSAGSPEYLTFRRDPGKDDRMTVLFNAWCQEDTVHMKDELERQEYVLNPIGNIWIGNKYYNHGIPWNFGQFEDVSLKTCLYVLDISKDLGIQSRGDPVMVSRFISKMANSKDQDGGILVGKWCLDKDTPCTFHPYTNPGDWTGSVKILEKYNNLKDKREGVKYGQCWVFAGLVTTLCRAIGIPTRCITNFSSGRDTDESTTIDFHFINGEPIDYLNTDFVWNFHVWNECFFNRPDLPRQYDGWQVIDAAPQETSQGVYCCGPAPVKAIKEGMVYVPYDTRFVFGEVNGDRVYWDVDNNGEMEVSSIDKFSVGKKISTKAIGSSARNDVTYHYKHKDGTPPERAAVRRAYKMSSRRNTEIYDPNEIKDVDFDFVPPDADLMVGNDFDVQLKMKNKRPGKRTVDVTIVTKTAFYNGITAVNLDKLQKTCELQSTKEVTVSLPVPASKYIGTSPADTIIKAFLTAKVKETKQVFHDIEVIELMKPVLNFEYGQKTVIGNSSFDLTVSFKNPLKIALNNCVFNIETSHYVSPNTITETLENPVEPQKEASIRVTLKPQRQGRGYVVAKFTSDQLSGVDGKTDFTAM